MKVSYLTAPQEGVLTLGHEEKYKNHPHYLFVKPLVKEHQNFLSASSVLYKYLLDQSEINEIEMLNHHEVLYYTVINKSFFNLKKIHYSKEESHSRSSSIMTQIMIKEARRIIESELHKSRKRAFPKTMKLSICMTTFNRTRELEEALIALSNQSDKDFELIVINDGSTDKEVLIFHEKIKEKYFSSSNWKWIDQENAYLGAARNRGAKESSGDVLLFLDDDNIPEIKMVETYRRYYKEIESDVFVSNLNIFYDLKRHELTPWYTFPDADFSSTLSNVISDAQCLIDKKLFFEMGGYTTDRNVGYEDWEFFLKLKLRKILIHPIVEPQYFYRVHKDDVSMRSQTKAMLNNLRAIRVLQQQNPRMARAYLFNIGLYNISNFKVASQDP